MKFRGRERFSDVFFAFGSVFREKSLFSERKIAMFWKETRFFGFDTTNRDFWMRDVI